MAKVLIVAEHADGKLNGSTAKCVTAAQALSLFSSMTAVPSPGRAPITMLLRLPPSPRRWEPAALAVP